MKNTAEQQIEVLTALLEKKTVVYRPVLDESIPGKWRKYAGGVPAFDFFEYKVYDITATTLFDLSSKTHRPSHPDLSDIGDYQILVRRVGDRIVISSRGDKVDIDYNAPKIGIVNQATPVEEKDRPVALPLGEYLGLDQHVIFSKIKKFYKDEFQRTAVLNKQTQKFQFSFSWDERRLHSTKRDYRLIVKLTNGDVLVSTRPVSMLKAAKLYIPRSYTAPVPNGNTINIDDVPFTRIIGKKPTYVY